MTDLSSATEQQVITVNADGSVAVETELLQEETPTIINSDEIIDATQNAIIGAAENISEALTTETQVPEHTQESELPPYLEAEFWVGMAFVLVVVSIIKPVWRALKGVLEKNISTVVDNINNAAKLRDDAQALLADYEHRCADLDKRLSDINAQTEKNIASYRQAELTKLQNELYKREKEVVERINRATEQAKNDINSSISKYSVALVTKAVKKYLSPAEQSAMIDAAIQDLDKFTH